MALNEAPDIETDLRFGRCYASFGLVLKFVLALLGLFSASDFIGGPDLIAELVNVVLSPTMLAVHVVGVVAAVYFAKRMTGTVKHLFATGPLVWNCY